MNGARPVWEPGCPDRPAINAPIAFRATECSPPSDRSDAYSTVQDEPERSKAARSPLPLRSMT
jgi:hypothetical protein